MQRRAGHWRGSIGERALYLRLTGDEAVRWGATRADLPGGDTHASVSLPRAS